MLGILVAVTTIAAIAASAACGDDGGGATGPACTTPVHERLDPRFQQHLLPGAAEGDYLTDPPTSGAHRPGLPQSDVLRTPLDRPTQVGALEAGAVVIQYRTTHDRRSLEALAGPLVYVAPNRSLPAPVVATAWRWKQSCQRVDVDALRTFVRAHRGRTPGS